MNFRSKWSFTILMAVSALVALGTLFVNDNGKRRMLKSHQGGGVSVQSKTVHGKPQKHGGKKHKPQHAKGKKPQKHHKPQGAAKKKKAPQGGKQQRPEFETAAVKAALESQDKKAIAALVESGELDPEGYGCVVFGDYYYDDDYFYIYDDTVLFTGLCDIIILSIQEYGSKPAHNKPAHHKPAHNKGKKPQKHHKPQGAAKKGGNKKPQGHRKPDHQSAAVKAALKSEDKKAIAALVQSGELDPEGFLCWPYDDDDYYFYVDADDDDVIDFYDEYICTLIIASIEEYGGGPAHNKAGGKPAHHKAGAKPADADPDSYFIGYIFDDYYYDDDIFCDDYNYNYICDDYEYFY